MCSIGAGSVHVKLQVLIRVRALAEICLAYNYPFISLATITYVHIAIHTYGGSHPDSPLYIQDGHHMRFLTKEETLFQAHEKVRNKWTLLWPSAAPSLALSLLDNH